jgi:PAS domain S-box-containing protein
MEIKTTADMTRNYILVLVLLAVTAIGSFVVLRMNMSMDRSAAAVVNVSGRQRMLLQRSALFAHDLVLDGDAAAARAKLLDAIDNIARSHRGLLDGDPLLGLPGKPSTAVRAILYEPPHELDKQINAYVADARALAGASPEARTLANRHLRSMEAAADSRLLLALDTLVKQYQRESEARVSRLAAAEVIIMLVTLLVLIASGLLVFRPMVGRIREDFDKVAKAETKVRAVIENMFDGLVTFDERGIIDSFNHAAERIFGYSPDEVIGQNLSVLIPAMSAEAVRGGADAASSSGVREVLGLKKDGRALAMDFSASEMKTGSRRMYIATMRDITERKAIETELVEKNRALEESSAYDRSFGIAMALFSSSYDRGRIFDGTLSMLAENHFCPVSALYLHDEWNGCFTCAASHGASDDLRREFGLDEGIIGQAASERRTIVVGSSDPSLPMTIEAGIRSYAPAATLVTPIFFQDRTIGVIALGSSQPFKKRDRAFIERLASQLGVAINNLDQYTSLKELSDQLKLKSREIAGKNAELEQASKLKSEFLANMSHELRTPLNAIIGFSEVMKDGVVGALTDEQAEYMTDIYQSGHHLLSLVNDILDLAKIEAGKMTLEAEETNLRELLENSMSIVREKAVGKGIALKLKMQAGTDYATVDPRKLKQIIYNLLANAVKFTDDGGAVTLEARKSGVPGREFFVFSVTDTGMGIPADGIDKLFKPFVQLDGSASRRHEGTGLGLALVHRLVGLHGGTVDVKSEPGKGSVFTVRVPGWLSAMTYDGVPVDAAINGSGAQRRKSASRVLLVEDDDSGAEIMRLQLETEGYSVERVSSAEEALKVAEAVMPDLIILDILLPGMNGLELLEKLKGISAIADVPVVVVSIVADAEMKKGFSLGAASVLQKPIERAVLVSVINDVVNARPRGGEKAKVLVVDDDHMAVDLVCRTIEEAGITALRAYNGRDGIETAISERPDLILLDLMMPDVSGFDVVEVLRKRQDTAVIPIIIVTAKTLTDEERDELSGYVTRVVRKSEFSRDAFMTEVRRALIGKPGATGANGTSGAAEPVEVDLWRKKAWPARIKGAETAVGPRVKKHARSPLILVAEDNPSDSDILRLFLEDAGYAIAQAADGREALAFMAETRPDLIILDLMMPNMDGFAFLAEKSKETSFSGIPVIIVSGVADGVNGSVLGVNAVLRKPIRRRDLLDVTASLGVKPVERRRQRVLVIDDDPKAVKLISSYFSESSYDVHQAYGGEEGLAEIFNRKPDLVVLDLMMPGANGFEILKSIRGDAATRHIPVIVMTAKMLTKAERDMLASQANMVAEKGRFKKESLLAEIESLLGLNRV